jgi:hypothetical protein
LKDVLESEYEIAGNVKPDKIEQGSLIEEE